MSLGINRYSITFNLKKRTRKFKNKLLAVLLDCHYDRSNDDSPDDGNAKKFRPLEMLSGILGMPVFVGWIMHYMIGIIFAFAYTYLCIFKHKISNIWHKGTVFGVIALIFAQIMMALMGMRMPMPAMEGSMMLTMIGSLMGYIIFGMAVSKTVGDTYCSSKSCEKKTA